MKSFALAAAFFSAATSVHAECADDRLTVVGDWGKATFTVDVADDPSERAEGLMFVESMPTLSGMLFVYEAPSAVSFWMKNTLIPLDMIFAGPEGAVVSVHENAIPGDLTPIPGGDDIQFVLEINGGLSQRLGIGPGDTIQHPSIGTEALLPCEAQGES